MALLGYGLENRGSVPGSGKDGILLFATASRSILVSTQPRVQWVPGTLSVGF